MTATARHLRAGHWSDVAANQPKYPEPADPEIKSKADIAVAVIVWVGGVFCSLALIAGIAYLGSHL